MFICNWTLPGIVLMHHPLWRENGFVNRGNRLKIFNKITYNQKTFMIRNTISVRSKCFAVQKVLYLQLPFGLSYCIQRSVCLVAYINRDIDQDDYRN
jgi:hypothetical protein